MSDHNVILQQHHKHLAKTILQVKGPKILLVSSLLHVLLMLETMSICTLTETSIRLAIVILSSQKREIGATFTSFQVPKFAVVSIVSSALSVIMSYLICQILLDSSMTVTLMMKMTPSNLLSRLLR